MNPLYIGYVLAVVGLLELWAVWKQKVTVGAKNLTTAYVIGLLILASGAYLGNFGSYINADLQSPFLTVAPTTTGGTTVVPSTSASATHYQIKTFNVKMKAKYSNSYSSVNGYLKIYDKDADPSDANTNPIATISIGSGSGTASSPGVTTDTPYKVVFDGNGTYYDEDFGVIQFSSKDYDPQQGVYLFTNYGTVDKPAALIATIADPLDESDLTGTIDGESSTNLSAGAELGCPTGNCANDATLVYDESNGDGSFYIEPDFSFTGANAEIRKPVLCFKWDETNGPEGNEITGMTYQTLSGSDLGVPSDILNYWKNEECVSLGTVVRSGTMSSARITITVDESNLDANDDWKMYVDDLGDIKGKDVVLNTGAAYKTISFDDQA